MACAYGWGVAFDWVDDGSGQLGTEGIVVGAVEVGAEVFAGSADGEVAGEEALDGVGDFGGGDAIAEGTRGAGVLADGAAYAEEEGVD